MLVVVSDTHGTDSHRLDGRTLDAVREADLVIHAGDLMTETVLDAFHDETDRLLAVYGNNDDRATRDRIPDARVVEYGGLRFAVTHTQRGGATALSLFGRERDADAVIFGHSHKPEVETTGEVQLLNPGSHADPRRYRPAHAELEPVADAENPTLRGRLVAPSGEVYEQFRLSQRRVSE
ncbi:metallophosphoesterase [Salinirubrum litoreum]|uniref:Phosphoesterase n=1 Tax=Salinirubrum litoreum TaxID=1126234 RepID=A0ABD5RA03_9EURY|nr:metallophosphoesterase [Salinirubrum litoreum]